MLEPKASRFYQAALQSGLIDEAGLEACFALIPPEKRTHDAIDRRMARQAITTGRLTLWQAQQIMGGHRPGSRSTSTSCSTCLAGVGWAASTSPAMSASTAWWP